MRIRVNGLPAPQGSKVRTPQGGLRESSQAVGPWREAVRAQTQLVMSRDKIATVPRPWPCTVLIQFYLPRPGGHYGRGRNEGILKPSSPDYPAGKPDLDKLQRAVLDGLTAGGAWADDAQVVSINAVKVYADDIQPGCEIYVRAASKLARFTVTDPRETMKEAQ